MERNNRMHPAMFSAKYHSLVDASLEGRDVTDEQVLQQLAIADELTDVLYDYINHYRDVGYNRGWRIDRVNDVPTIKRNEVSNPDHGPGYWTWSGKVGMLGTDIAIFWGGQAGLGINFMRDHKCMDIYIYLPGCNLNLCISWKDC